ncbi:MAG: hypothetical protein PHT95_08690, partial [Candidatus Omnitrophica bacterium]|nr:hypothetical protein [Candidatus Omnitrophota bacterium]
GASGTQVPVGTGTENYLSKWSASGTLGDSVVYDDGTKVGIGTTTPEEKLHIGTGSILIDNSQFFKQKDSSGTARQVFVADSSNNLYFGSSSGWTGGLVLQYPNTAVLKILSGASEKVRIDSSGNVGIGTNAPVSKVHIWVNETDNALTLHRNTTIAGDTVALNFGLTTGASPSANLFGAVKGVRIGGLALYDGGDTGTLQETMRLYKGNVGIGTTTPATKLDILGDLTLSTAKTGTASRRIGMRNGNNISLMQFDFPEATSIQSDVRFFRETNNSVAPQLIIFKADGTNSPQTIFSARGTSYINAISGNVGIGTKTPAYTLDVSGDIRATGTIYGASGTQVPVGTGTENYLSKWSASGTLGDSVLYDDGTNVGIGTTGPGAKLHVSGGYVLMDNNYYLRQKNLDGAIKNILGLGNDNVVRLYSSDRELHLNPDTNTKTFLNFASDADVIMVAGGSSGNVGIGTTAPGARLDIAAGNLDLDNTTNTNQFGVITKNGARFIHDFNYGNNGTVTTGGKNTFLGLEAGNLTMGSAATETYHGSYNTGVGYQALQANTIGNSNSGLGTYALFSNTTGQYNAALGVSALASNTIGSNNAALGVNALQNNTTGSSNAALGVGAGRFLTDGTTGNATSNSSLFLGNDTRSKEAGQTNEIVIGASALGAGSNSVTLGNDSITKTLLKGNVGIGTTSPGTKLDVYGSLPKIRISDSRDQDWSTNNVLGSLEFYTADTVTSDPRVAASISQITDYSGSHNTPRGALQFNVSTTGAASEAMRISSAGNVGIGTTSPSYTLDVSGDIRATGTIYGASGTQVPVGTGTENYLSKWSASGTLGDSVVYDD